MESESLALVARKNYRLVFLKQTGCFPFEGRMLEAVSDKFSVTPKVESHH